MRPEGKWRTSGRDKQIYNISTGTSNGTLPRCEVLQYLLWSFGYCTLCLAMPCRNICTRIGSSFGYYSAGIKYCRRCKVYLFHDGYICPCCKRPLRTSPNNRRGKEKLRTRQAIQQIDSNIIKTLERHLKAGIKNNHEVWSFTRLSFSEFGTSVDSSPVLIWLKVIWAGSYRRFESTYVE